MQNTIEGNNSEAEAALEALRAAIGQPTSPSSQIIDPIPELPPLPQSPPLPNPSTSITISSSFASLNELNESNLGILDALDMEVVAGNVGLRGLIDNCRKQYEIVKELSDNYNDLVESSIDPSLSIFGGSSIAKSRYDTLKAQYDSLLSSTQHFPGTRESSEPGEGGRPSKRVRRFKADSNEVGGGEGGVENLNAVGLGDIVDELAEDGTGEMLESLLPTNGEKKRKRSMKLEHLVHKMANRRLGVCYTIKDFECLGTTTLPAPSSEAPGPETSLNNIQEYRPDFGAEGMTGYRVKPFLDVVCEDVWDAWIGGVGEGEGYLKIDRKKVKESVQVYWVRLQKRYVEQLARQRGEVHKDEVTRRRQNQYRRQQSLLARRIVAFDASPLNMCKLRSLYRTLLTIDFCPPTNDRPDGNRVYSEEEWYAYQKVGGGGLKGVYDGSHEVVDLFWLSPQCRDLLLLLDIFSLTAPSTQKRKGRPKTPSPTFHLPPTLWDRTNLPHLRPKDLNGLPIASSTGLVLFKFHVDEGVQRDYPDWAQGLYDHPPVGGDDVLLPGLGGLVGRGLRGMVRREKGRREVDALGEDEVREIMGTEGLPERFVKVEEKAEEDEMEVDEPLESRFDMRHAIDSEDTQIEGRIQSQTLDTALSAAEESVNVGEMISANLESFVNLARQHEHEQAEGEGGGVGGGRGRKKVGPSAGSSLRARKQSKRKGGGVEVGGMAEPFDKREVGEGAEGLKEVEGGLRDDQGFLGGL